jgi:hypothetical protein
MITRRKEVRMSETATLGSAAKGGIGVKSNQQRKLSDAIKDSIDSFYVPTSAQVVATCIDGRLPDAGETLNPNSAGGSLSLWVAAVLSGAEITLEEFLRRLRANDVNVGSHTDTHAHGAATGCGANDKLEKILTVLADSNALNRIKTLMESVGVDLGPHARAHLKAAAVGMLAKQALGSASERLACLSNLGPCDVLVGSHDELVVIINTVPGTTLSRRKLAQQLGAYAAAFNVDAWAFDGSIDAIVAACDFEQPKEFLVETLKINLVAFNLATAFVLCDSSMPVVMR